VGESERTTKQSFDRISTLNPSLPPHVHPLPFTHSYLLTITRVHTPFFIIPTFITLLFLHNIVITPSSNMSSPLSKISSFAYDDMPSPASWLSSPASKKMHSPASKLSSSASKMSVAKFEKTPTKSEMYSPIPKKSAHKAKTASMDSKCTTFSDIIRALDETHDRIASMGVKEMKQDRVDSLRVLEGGHPKGTHLRAFDTKKYMKDYENGDITLLQIQVAANATKLPEEHRADWIAVNGSEYLRFLLPHV
jgi:hypothetical protein